MEPLSEDISQEWEKKKTYIQNMYPFYGYGIYAVLLKQNHSKKLIGLAGFQNGEDGLELGYIFHRDYRGMGYAIESCRELLRFAKEYLYAEEIFCRIDEENLKSRTLCERLGFSEIDRNEKIVYKREL